jgi:hypothetical protein
MAQEPLALRPQVADALSKAQLRSMIGTLESLLSSMPDTLDSLPADVSESLRGAYLQDWRTLTASSGHGAEGVRHGHYGPCLLPRAMPSPVRLA